ncbi:MAG: exo-alpha-sialidase [Gemmatimonadetes bacterium]|nr:exo-alpha-sialidase [Gemmatimonadota bacterium]MBT6148889.1 exo-alpha-sialidase [Gemmatimonadota bacterium]MBT7864393.1 exo-alpha-sialidase [Gemmatimonadota bacterium]
MTANNSPTQEGTLEPLCTEARMEWQEIFSDERFPNVVIALDGTVIATWGAKNLTSRRSTDGGATWESPIPVGDGIHAGGTTVDEMTGEILFFGHPDHPPKDIATAPRKMYRSSDEGRTWAADETVFEVDERGHVPSLHFCEHGITLHRGAHVGRLLRPARVYVEGAGYNMAVFSDDHGRTWHASAPFPVDGTGEGCVVELADGRIYYSSRQHRFAEGEPLRCERLHAWSHDGGATWQDATHSSLPDGPRYRGQDKRGANYNGHFGMAAGLTRLPVAGRDILLYSNADEESHERVRMTVWASFDGGLTWPVKRLIDEGPSAYSSLEAGRPGTPSEGWIYLQYEERNGGGRLARFNLSWVIEGEATGDGNVPE